MSIAVCNYPWTLTESPASMSIYSQAFASKHPDIDLSDYFEFIKLNSLAKSVKFKTANHHILPKWAFPEVSNFAKFKWNKSILTHRNHLLAHFMLWKVWRAWQNASPLLLMCEVSDIKAFDTDINQFSEEYESACIAHGEQTSEHFSGMIYVRLLSDNTNVMVTSEEYHLGKNTLYESYSVGPRENSLGMVRAKLISDNSNIYLTSEEYESGKGVIYKMHSTGKPSWNNGIEMTMTKGKISVFLTGTKDRVFIETSEYNLNKDLYDHPAIGNVGSKGKVGVFDNAHNRHITVSVTEYKSDKSRYTHPTKNKAWYNNGLDQLRLTEESQIPAGYVPGRLPETLKGFKKQTITCPHCNLTGGRANMIRYKHHFEFCKLNPDNISFTEKALDTV